MDRSKWGLLHNSNYNIEAEKEKISFEIKNILIKTKDVLENKTPGFLINDLFAISVYKFEDSEELGAILVDKTEGVPAVFPLVFYPNTMKSIESENRFYAINSALKDILEHWNEAKYDGRKMRKKYFEDIMLPNLDKNWSSELQVLLAENFDDLSQ